MKKLIFAMVCLLNLAPSLGRAFQISCYPHPSIPDMAYEVITIPGYSVAQTYLQIQHFEHGATTYESHPVKVFGERHRCVPKKNGEVVCAENLVIYKGEQVELTLHVNSVASDGTYFGEFKFYRNGVPDQDRLICSVIKETKKEKLY
ncbi:hypothetical protein [Bdellovibrio reynosensis]|uniref:Uncharacterized protein n=1 Tax=Bdellovibrio reynosensis TaxID=2835041 RepID=A0ABY4C7Q3_9BACT|nr:hypothetical protein [Bdellovibrio reynosensis]UOF00918.1 hypothetical protein MNR06_14545 [Bdellovibrio reynosensis]